MPSTPGSSSGPRQWLTRATSFPLKRMTPLSSLSEYSVNESRYLPRNPRASIFNRKDLLGDLSCNKFPINYFSDHLCALCRATFCLKAFEHLSNPEAIFKHHDGCQLALCATNGCNFCGLLMDLVPEEGGVSSELRCIFSWAIKEDCGQLVLRFEGRPGQPITRFIRVFSRGEEAIQRFYSVQTFFPKREPVVTTNDDENPFKFPPAPNLNDGNEVARKQMNTWLNTCLKYHRRCGSKDIPVLPTRIIDVEKNRLYISKSGESAKYVALSYCWGGPQKFRVTNSTLSAMKKDIPESLMPKTLQDAVFVTRQLGLRYLWIDSLCILQDDDADMATEINKMHLIYKNATVVIGAEVPASAEEGFLRPRVLEGCITVPFASSKDRNDEICLLPELSNQLPKEALANRAWAFQETILTSRLLIFSRRGIDWSCTSFHGDENNQVNTQYTLRRQTHTHRHTFSSQSTSNLLRLSSRDKDLWLKWQSLLSDYIPLDLTFLSDKLPALAGIAQEFQLLNKSRYVAGMWMKDLSSQLGWFRPLNEPSIQSPEYQAPTWSWASINGKIEIPNIYQPYEMRTEVLITACIVESLHKQAPYGRVEDGFLEVDAYTLPVASVPWSWLTFSSMDYNAEYFDGDDQEGGVECLILGHHVRYRWEGLFIRSLGDGMYQRIGFFRLGEETVERREESVRYPSQLGAERRRLTII